MHNKENEGKNFIKVLVNAPYENRYIILKLNRKKKALYLQETSEKHSYVGHSYSFFKKFLFYAVHAYY